MVGVCSGDDAKDGVSVSDRVLKALEYRCANSISATVARSFIIKSIAVSLGAEEMTAIESGKVVWIGQHIRASGDGGVAFTAPKMATRRLNGGKTRRTGSIDTEARTGKSKEIAATVSYSVT